MPDYSKHCPMILYTDPANAASQLLASLDSIDAGWTDFTTQDLTVAPAIPSVPDSFLQVSRCAGASVAAQNFTPPIQPPLRAVIRMPLGAPINAPDGAEVAGITVTFGAANPSQVHVNGRAELHFETKGASLQVGNVTLTPDADGAYHIEFINTPMSHLNFGKKMDHPAGQRLDHIQSYFSLLDNPRDRPTFTVTYPFKGPPAPSDLPCPGLPAEFVPSPSPLGALYIDPYNCTVGIGCPPDDSGCM
jgi:hypothetical protein